MLFLLSPAKALDYETPASVSEHSLPQFTQQSSELIKILKTKSQSQIASLMDLSDALASLNLARYQAWSPKCSTHNAKQAVLAFNGDVYEGLDAKTLPLKDLQWAQQHLCMLSGLYGVLRPLDLMQPYRLEMGTKLVTPQGKNLYQFWGTRIAQYLNEQAQADRVPVVVNLASQEYFKAVDSKELKPRVVSCVFEEFKAGKYKIISFMAKRARGLMARYAVQHRIASVKKLEEFDVEGYQFCPDASQTDRLVFRRKP